jgi:hypothetical protein
MSRRRIGRTRECRRSSAHSALLRGHAHPEQRRHLWIRLRKSGGTELTADVGAASRLAIQRWALKQRLNGSTSTINELTDFRTQALARLAAQHDEITRLRNVLARAHKVRPLPLHEVTSSAPSEAPGRDE